jgi:hypothetical protein
MNKNQRFKIPCHGLFKHSERELTKTYQAPLAGVINGCYISNQFGSNAPLFNIINGAAGNLI